MITKILKSYPKLEDWLYLLFLELYRMGLLSKFNLFPCYNCIKCYFPVIILHTTTKRNSFNCLKIDQNTGTNTKHMIYLKGRTYMMALKNALLKGFMILYFARVCFHFLLNIYHIFFIYNFQPNLPSFFCRNSWLQMNASFLFQL